jgi:hypothetical protein
MTRQTAFEQFVAFADKNDTPREPISQEDFELWQKDVIWDALYGLRYGQSFCNRFNISDNLLYYNTWPPEQIDDYIKKNYIERS